MRAVLAASILLAISPVSQAAPQLVRTRADASLPPRGFGSVGFEVRNNSSSEAEFQLEAEVSHPLQLTGAAKRTVKVSANSAETFIFNLYAPVGTREGGSLKVKANDLRTGETAQASHIFGITPKPALEAKTLTLNGDIATVLHSRGNVSSPWELALFNKGNTPLDIVIEAQCSPQTATLTGLPTSISLEPGESKRLPAFIQNASTTFTEAVARVRVQGFYKGEPLEATHHFVRLESYPDAEPVNPSDLYEQLRSTAGFAAGFVDDQPIMFQTLETEGLIAPNTLLRFQGQLTTLEDETVSIPGYNSRSFMRLSIQAPNWSFEVGEVRHDFGRILSPSERGDGVRFSAKLAPEFRFTVYAAESNYTFSDKQTGGLIATLTPDPAHTVELQALTVRNDPTPGHEQWSAGSASWTYTPSKNFLLGLQGAYSVGSEFQGGAVGANLLWRGKPLNMPAELRLEGELGDKGFSGSQRGLQDGRISLSLEPIKDFRINGQYYRSRYEVDPFFEETIEERQSIAPEFTRRVTTNATLLSATWGRKYPMTLAFQENTSFQKNEFSQESRERSVNFSVSRQTPSLFASLTLRGGTEDRQDDVVVSSRFVSAGLDTSFPVKTSKGELSFQASARYSHNLDGDDNAVNRTGLWVNAGTTFVPGKQTSVATRWNVDGYAYERGDRAVRVRGGIQYRLNAHQEIGLEGSYTLHDSGSYRRQETAILFTYRHFFGTPVPWMPIRGAAQGTIYNDVNVNGIQDPGEAGVPDVAVQVGAHRTLTGPKGEFYLPAMEPGETAVAFSDPAGAPLHFSTQPSERTMIRAGKIGEMTMGIVVPQRVDGVVQVAESIKDSVGILAQEEGGSRIVRSFTRGDGTFSLYLEAGTYKVTPEALDSNLEATPKEILVTVAPDAALPTLRFEVKEKVRLIKRKVFQQQ